MHASAARCLSTGMGRSPPNPGSLFYVLRYPNGQREKKCVLAQEALFELSEYSILEGVETVPSPFLQIFWGEKYIFIRDFQSEYWNALRTGLVL